MSSSLAPEQLARVPGLNPPHITIIVIKRHIPYLPRDGPGLKRNINPLFYTLQSRQRHPTQSQHP